jgi:hypothetical protein
LRHFDIDVPLLREDGETLDWWRVARVQFDVEAVVEHALDNIRALTEAARSPEAEEFVAIKATEEERLPEEVREQLRRHADYCLQRARRELRQLAPKAFEPLMREALQLTGEILAAAAMDRMPDFFGATTRQEAREYAISHARKMVSPWLKLGRPSAQPPLPDEAAEFVRLVEVGRQLFADVRRPLEPEMLSAVERSVRTRLSNRRERTAADRVVKSLRHREIKGTDVQPKKLALIFAANLNGIHPSTRPLQRMYDEAVKVLATG